MSEPVASAETTSGADAVIANYLRQRAAGAEPDAAVVLDQHPEHRAELEAFFAEQKTLGRPAGERRASTSADASADADFPHLSESVRYVGDYVL